MADNYRCSYMGNGLANHYNAMATSYMLAISTIIADLQDI